VSADNVNVGAGADIVTSGTGTITLAAFNMEFNNTATIISASTVTITHETAFTGRNINLGSDGSSIFLNLTDAELDCITADTTRIVTVNGQLSVSGTITHSNHLSLVTTAGPVIIGFPITMAPDKNFTADNSTQAIQLSAGGADITTSGTGAILLTAGRDFSMSSAGSALNTENGGITISANGGSTGSFAVDIAGTVTSTGTGNISISGHGSQAGGVRIQGTIQSTSAANAPTQGKILIDGVNGSNSNAAGVFITGGVTSNSGDIEIIGGGGTGGSSAQGVHLTTSAQVTTANAASISITGTGGVSGSSQAGTAAGIFLTGTLQSQNGDITLQGTGGSSSSTSPGVSVGLLVFGASTPRVTSTSGAILFEGSGGSGGINANGVQISGASGPTVTGGGSLSLVGTPGAHISSFGVVLSNTGSTAQTISELSAVTITADSFARLDEAQISSTGTVTLLPLTPGTLITLGGSDVMTGVKQLGLSNSELLGIFAERIVVGDATSGDIKIDTAISPDANRSRNMELITGGDIVFNAALSTVGSFSGGMTPATGSLLLSTGPNGSARPLASPSDITTAAAGVAFATSFAPDANLAINIEGTALNTEFNQLKAVGDVDLAGANLVLFGSFVSSLDDVFAIVAADSVTDQLNGLPENKVFTRNGRSLRVNYTATSVTLTDVGQPPTIEIDAAAVSAGEGSPAANSGTFDDPDGNATATVTASIGTVTQNNELGTWSWSVPTTDGPAGPFVVTITVTDAWGATHEVTFQYSVSNLPPAVTNLVGPAEIARGLAATFTGEFEDPGGDAWHGEARFARAGHPDVVVPIVIQPGGTFSFEHEFADAGVYDVTVTVSDDEAGTPLSEIATVHVFIPGDYDRNGAVAPADHAEWATYFGATNGAGLQADGNGNGIVDAADYVIWRKNLGMTAAAGAGNVVAAASTGLPARDSAFAQSVAASVIELNHRDESELNRAISISVADFHAENSTDNRHDRRARTKFRAESPRVARVDNRLLIELVAQRLLAAVSDRAAVLDKLASGIPHLSKSTDVADMAFAAIEYGDATWPIGGAFR
jgi:hypothetical protein